VLQKRWSFCDVSHIAFIGVSCGLVLTNKCAGQILSLCDFFIDFIVCESQAYLFS